MGHGGGLLGARANPCITVRRDGAARAHAPTKWGMASARDIAADLLLRFDRKGERVSAGLDAARESMADHRERGLLTELAYGCVRRQGTLDALIASASTRPVHLLHASLRTALRLALYQVFFLDRVPSHAAVDHAVGWARGVAGPGRAGFVNGVARNLLRAIEGKARGTDQGRRDIPREDGTAIRMQRDVFPDPADGLGEHLAARYGMPLWLVERWLGAWGEARTLQILRAGIQRPPVTVRARIDRAELMAKLKERDIACDAGPGDTALCLADGEAAVQLTVRSGDAAVQDATSQRVAPAVAPTPGESVLDLCAAPGGKTLHLADLMGSGRIVACDVDAAKVALLEGLAERMGDIDYETVLLEPESKLPFAPESFDAILVDAPCSNTGVLRRRVEARWRLRPKDIASLVRIQAALLARCVPALKPGGRIVYSTCSLEAEENEALVEAFVASHPAFEAKVAFRAWPRENADGGFVAVLTHRP